LFATVVLVLTVAGCPNKRPNVGPVVNGDKGKKDPDDKGSDLPVAPGSPPKWKEPLTLSMMSASDKAEYWREVQKDKQPVYKSPLDEPDDRPDPTNAVPHRLSFTPDGRLLVAHARVDASQNSGVGAKIWEVPTGRPFAFWAVSGDSSDAINYFPALAVSPDGKRLFAALERTNKVYDLSNRKFLATVPAGAEPLFHPNGKWVVMLGGPVGAIDATTGIGTQEFKLYRFVHPNGEKPRFETCEARASATLDDPVIGGPNFKGVLYRRAGALSPDGGLFAFTGVYDPFRDIHRDSCLAVLATTPGREQVELAKADDPLGLPVRLFFTPDGKRLVGLSHPNYGPLETDRPDVVRVWRVADGKVLATGKVPSPARDMALSPDGHWVALGCKDGVVRLLAAATGAEVLDLKGHKGPVNAVAFSPDGRLLASGGDDGSVRLWKAE
jgi:WD40 repeat protein